jgi:hypothetical protein
MLRFDAQGMTEMTSSGEVRYSRRQAVDALRLLDDIRAHGRSSPAFVTNWVLVNKSPLAAMLADGLYARGYSVTCRLCAKGLDGRSYSRSTLQRLHGIDASRHERKEHRWHFRRRSLWNSTNPGRPEEHREAHEPPPPGQNEQGRRLLDGEPAVPPLVD